MMKVLTDWLVTEIAAAVPGADIKVGAMPVGNGIGVYAAANAVDAEYMTRSRNIGIKYSVSCKDSIQANAFMNLIKVHERLTLRREYAVAGDDWHIRWVRSGSMPVYAGTEEDGRYIYGSSIEISIYKEN